MGTEFPRDRGTWQGRFDFILSLIGYSVGLGNVWRFPYLVYSNGGGAFLIPFIVMMLLVGFPLMFMELAFGQYASLSPVVIYKHFSPLFAGLGYGMIAVSGVVMLYYNMIIAWTLYYMYASLKPELPWSRCDPLWSTDLCYSYKEKDDCIANDPNAIYYNRTCFNHTDVQRLNLTTNLVVSQISPILEKKAPADEYFNNYVLGNIETIDETGNIQFHLLISLLIAWIMVFLCLSKGVQSSGKVVYFTALFPYLVLVILFIRGITLPGAMQGIAFYVKPDFSHLFAAHVWGDAAVQVFFALSPAWGGLITLASYNKFTNNCYRDSILVLFANAGTSIFSGFVVFSIIGYLAHEMDVAVDEVVDQGVGLAFIVYPEVVARLPISPFWSFLFFFMLITLGLDSQFALLETVQTAVLDRFPALRDHKMVILLLVSTLGYAGGIIFTTQSGVLWLGLFDHYAANFSVLIIAITECLLIAWYYGTERFLRDIEKMIGQRSLRWKRLWSIMWKYITPSILMFLLIFNWIKHEPPKSGDYIYPEWSNIFGWILAFIPTIIIIATMLHTYFTYDGGKNKSIAQKINTLMQPSENWGPTHKNIEKLQRRKSSRLAMMAPEQSQSQQQQQQQSSSISETTNGTYSHRSVMPLTMNGGPLPQQTTATTIKTNGNIVDQQQEKLRPLKLKQTVSDPTNKRNYNQPPSSSSTSSILQPQNSFDNPSFNVQFPAIKLQQPPTKSSKSESANRTPRI
ncbi:hypothetical protein HUG17_2884 [Dermatophagoides farinae]|uniref:Transporter n=1 Tax=Dermatophagoides farinae TaxID=6954 RepID=A0A9D4NV51_DERFA|nr:hypothetical protein HUG17_2884 [Dermatophagoides farinae]